MAAQERDEHGHFLPSDRSKASPPEPFSEVGKSDASGVVAGALSEAAALMSAGLDATDWEITNWRIGTYRGETSTRWSAKRRPRPLVDPLDVEDLLRAADAWGTPAKPAPITGQDALVVCLSDWQVGGTGPGGGTRDTIARVLALGGALVERVNDLRLTGRSVPELLVLGLGDIVEACSNFYASQLFTVDLDNRAQLKTSYMLVSALLRQWAPLFSKITVAPIGGNHGELGRGAAGKNQTGTADNADVLVFEIVRDVLAERPGFEHFQWRIPDGDLSAVVEVAGVPVGFTHGHLFGGGAGAAAKATKWWVGQTFGIQPVKDARILVNGHFHHWSSVEFAEAGRTWFQCPALDNGSQWFTETSGQSSAPGTLTFRVGRNCGARLWDDVALL